MHNFVTREIFIRDATRFLCANVHYFFLPERKRELSLECTHFPLDARLNYYSRVENVDVGDLLLTWGEEEKKG